MASSKPASRLSSRERALYALVPQDGTKVTSAALVILYYEGEVAPINGQQIIVGRLSRIMKKQEAADLPVRLRKGPRVGPNPMQFWVGRK